MSVPGSQMQGIAAEAWPLAGPVRLAATASELGPLAEGLLAARDRLRSSPWSLLDIARHQPAAFRSSSPGLRSEIPPEPSDLRAQQAHQHPSQPIFPTLHQSFWFLAQPIPWRHVTPLAGWWNGSS